MSEKLTLREKLHIGEKRAQCIGIGRKVDLVGGHGSP